jgi:adenylate kinase family enzyme
MFDANSKIVVVGTSGSGKSHLARRISEKFGLKRIELDALHWEPNWVETPREVFRARIAQAIEEAGGGWVIDGNYGKANDVFWPKADTIIWLDYPFTKVFRRAFIRTMRRWIMREELWSGNRESLRMSFFSKESILLWVIQTHKRRSRQFTACLENEWKNHRVVRVRTEADLRKILA